MIDPAFHSPSTTEPQLLVLMATCDGARWLDEQINSILEQRGVRLRLIISDDCSTDATPALIEGWARRDPRVELLAPPQVRLGATGNFLRLLRDVPFQGADAIALADQDDIWNPGRLRHAAEMLSRSGAVGYSSEVTVFWPDGRSSVLGKGHRPTRLDFMFEPAGPGCTYVLSRHFGEALKAELARVPERFQDVSYHDWLTYSFARARGNDWILDPQPTVRYRQHGRNDTGANQGWRAAVKRLRRLRSGWYRTQILLLAELSPVVADEAAVELAHDVIQRVRRLSWSDRWWLARHVHWLRRNPRDQYALAALLLSCVLR